MQVAVDMVSAGRGFGPSAGGMIVYYSGLVAGLCDLPQISRVFTLEAPWNQGLAVPEHPKASRATCRGLPHNRIGRVAYEQTALPLLVKRLGADVLLSTCNVKPLARRGPSVVVLQSLQFLHFPDEFSPLRRAYLRASVGASLRAADRVITVTEWERTEALRLFGLDPDRAVTVYHGLSERVREAVSVATPPARPTMAGEAPYVLMVSSLYRFKNHLRLIRAFALTVQEHGLPHRLVLVGGDADVTSRELMAEAKAIGVGDRLLLLGAMAHDKVPALIHHADAVAYPSLYETFGHPVLEALAFGRPLVTSDHGATAEVAGGAARLVDARSVGSIAAGLADVLTDERLRLALMEAGPRRASTFTWEACALNTAAVLESAVSGGRGRPSRRTSRA